MSCGTGAGTAGAFCSLFRFNWGATELTSGLELVGGILGPKTGFTTLLVAGIIDSKALDGEAKLLVSVPFSKAREEERGSSMLDTISDKSLSGVFAEVLSEKLGKSENDPK